MIEAYSCGKNCSRNTASESLSDPDSAVPTLRSRSRTATLGTDSAAISQDLFGEIPAFASLAIVQEKTDRHSCRVRAPNTGHFSATSCRHLFASGDPIFLYAKYIAAQRTIVI